METTSTFDRDLARKPVRFPKLTLKVVCGAILLSLALPAASLAAPLKPRIVVLTDISPITADWKEHWANEVEFGFEK